MKFNRVFPVNVGAHSVGSSLLETLVALLLLMIILLSLVRQQARLLVDVRNIVLSNQIQHASINLAHAWLALPQKPFSAYYAPDVFAFSGHAHCAPHCNETELAAADMMQFKQALSNVASNDLLSATVCRGTLLTPPHMATCQTQANTLMIHVKWQENAYGLALQP